MMVPDWVTWMVISFGLLIMVCFAAFLLIVIATIAVESYDDFKTRKRRW